MGYSYGHRSTAFNGILSHLQRVYPESEAIKGITPIKGKQGYFSFKSVNDLMIEYRQSRNSVPSKDYYKNALYIHRDFHSFMNYLKNRYGTSKKPDNSES